MPEFGLIDYQLIRSKRKTLSLQIDKDGKLLVRAPMRFSVKKIEGFIDEKQLWIAKKQRQIKQNMPSKLSFKEGDKFLFLGVSYPLKIIHSGNPLSFKQECFFWNKNYEARAAFHWFYKKEFKKIALPQLQHYAQKHQLNYNQVRLKAQRTRWGSCSNKDNINLNYLLIMAPIWVINSVITHELAHTAHKNHSKDFYKLLTKMNPEHKKANIWLKQHGQKLHSL